VINCIFLEISISISDFKPVEAKADWALTRIAISLTSTKFLKPEKWALVF
jgi:hypothetical protein